MAVTRIWWDVNEKAWYCLADTDIANVPATITALMAGSDKQWIYPAFDLITSSAVKELVAETAELAVGTTLIVVATATLYKWNGDAFVAGGSESGGGGGEVTNAGTFAVQAELSATDNDVLDTIAAKDFATQTTLALIKAKTDNIPAQGQALAAASLPVILPAATITTLTPPAAITGFATETTLGTVHGHVDSLDTKTPALGQALAASSVPVVLTAAQITTLTPPAQGLTDIQLRASAVPTSLASVPSHAVTNAGTFAVQAAATLAAETTKVIGTVNLGATDNSVLDTMVTSLQLIDDTVFAEDTAATAADKGVAVLAVRRDADTTLVGADNDYANLQVNATGSLKVAVIDPIPERIIKASGIASLPVTGIPDGGFVHVVDTAVYGRFLTDHWYNMATGAVIV